MANERLYQLSADERDDLILELRAKGWTLAQVAKRVGMSRSGVSRAISRISEDGRPGVDRRA